MEAGFSEEEACSGGKTGTDLFWKERKDGGSGDFPT